MLKETVKSQLTELKLSTAAGELEPVLASYKKAANLDWVSDLLLREIDARREKRLQMRIRRASFPVLTSLEGFDWEFNPDIDQGKIRELAKLQFVKENGIALFLGKTGSGKTHLALAIGLLAVTAGEAVYCTSVKKLCADIMQCKMRGRLDSFFKRMLNAKLWILDDWGVVEMRREVAEEVFDLFDRRKHSSAMIVTSNREIEEWPRMFPDQILATATIDRMFESAEIVLFEGDSYRLRGRIMPKTVDRGVGKID